MLFTNVSIPVVYLDTDTNQGTWWALGPITCRGPENFDFLDALRYFLVHSGAGLLE